jgi:hypothetical protein
MGPEGLQGSKGKRSRSRTVINYFVLSFLSFILLGEQGLDGAPGLPGPQGENYEVSE